MSKIIRIANKTGLRGKANKDAQKSLDKTGKKLDKIEKDQEKSKP
jgi:hypothetical protein